MKKFSLENQTSIVYMLQVSPQNIWQDLNIQGYRDGFTMILSQGDSDQISNHKHEDSLPLVL